MTNTEWVLLKITAGYATLVHIEPKTFWPTVLAIVVVAISFDAMRWIGHKWEDSQ